MPVNHFTLTWCTVACAHARTWPWLACMLLCTLAVRAFMHVSLFINTANGFSAAPKFVCSVTRYSRRFIRQVSRIEAWLMTLSDTTGDDLTPGSGSWGRQSREGRGGGVGSKGGRKEWNEWWSILHWGRWHFDPKSWESFSERKNRATVKWKWERKTSVTHY